MQTVLNVLLTILKWIGLILLWILRIVFGLIALVILLIILVLSIPLRFHVDGHYRADDILANGSVSYFLKLVQANFHFKDNQFAYSVKVFGKTLLQSKPKPEEEDDASGDPSEKESEEKTEEKTEAAIEKSDETTEKELKKSEPKIKDPKDQAESKSEDNVKEKTEDKLKTSDQKADIPSVTESKSDTESSEEKKKDPSEKEDGKKSKKKKQKKIPEKKSEEDGTPDWAKDIMQPIGPGKLEQMWEKVGALLAKIDSYYALVRFYPDTRGLVRALKRLLIHLGKAFHFKPSELSLVYGMDDPAMLAQIMGGVYALMASSKWKKLSLSVDPAFCENRIEAEGDLNFTLVLRTLVGAILGLAINISVWKLLIYLLKLRKKGKKQNGRK